LSTRAKAKSSVKELKEKPPAEKKNRWKHKNWSEEKWRDDRLHAGMGEEAKVRAHDAGNRSTGTHGGNAGSRVGVDVKKGCSHTASKIESEITGATQAIFDVITEDPKAPHISKQVNPTAVQKHAAHNIKYGFRRK